MHRPFSTGLFLRDGQRHIVDPHRKNNPLTVSETKNDSLLSENAVKVASPETKENSGSSNLQTPRVHSQKDLETQKTEPSSNVTSTVPKINLSELKQDVYTIPNILTFTRILTTPLIGYFIVSGHPFYASSVFVYSCITDFLDGFIARRYQLKSVLGSILDPMADKFLMTVCTVSLGYQGGIPLYVAGLIIGRDVMLSFMAFYYRYVTLPAPKTLKRYMDLSIPTVSVHPNTLGKVNTALQMVFIGSVVMRPAFEMVLAANMLDSFYGAFGLLVATTTTLSGLSYLFSRNAFKVLK